MTESIGETIRLDLNSPEFQKTLFALEKDLQRQVLTTLRKLAAMTWDQLYRDPGLRWEAILSRVGPHGGRLYSLRISGGFRAVAFRDGSWLRLLTLHPDHDSAYRKNSQTQIIEIQIGAHRANHVARLAPINRRPTILCDIRIATSHTKAATPVHRTRSCQINTPGVK